VGPYLDDAKVRAGVVHVLLGEESERRGMHCWCARCARFQLWGLGFTDPHSLC
jgi:hypothetical protein